MMRKFSLSADGFYVPSIGSTNPITFVKQVKRVIQEKGPFAAVHAHTDFQSGFIALAARLAGVPVRICHSHSTSWRGGRRGLPGYSCLCSDG